MSTTSDELIDQFVRNGACQNILAENGDLLLSKMKFSSFKYFFYCFRFHEFIRWNITNVSDKNHGRYINDNQSL
jgi:hypothetical protein